MTPSIQRQRLHIEAGSGRRFDSLLFSHTHSFRFPANEGRLCTEMIDFTGADVRIGRVTSTGHEISLTEESRLTLLVPASGRLQVSIGRHICESDAGAMMAVRPGSRRTVVIPGAGRSYSAYLMMLPQRAVEQRLRETGGRAYLPSQPSALLDPERSRRLRTYLSFAVEDLLGAPGGDPLADHVLRGVPALMLDLLLDATEPVTMPAAFTADRVRLAEDLLRERADEPLSIAELAREMGVGLRSLQIAFRKVRGAGPREVLNCIRLDNARRRLLAADRDANVTRIALDSGFTHLGRFSEAYRDAFGERPIDTLRRTRRCA